MNLKENTLQHYDLGNGVVPEGSSRLTISFEDHPDQANLYLEVDFSQDLAIFGEISLFCSYAYHQREYYVMMDRLDSQDSQLLERILTGPPRVDADGNWSLRGSPASDLAGQVTALTAADRDAKNILTLNHRYFGAEITSETFPVESSLHRLFVGQSDTGVKGELASITVDVEGFGFRHRHEHEYTLISVAHLFAFLMTRHPGDHRFEEVLCRAAVNCLFPSVLNAKSSREDQQYFAAIAARYAFTGQPLPNV